MKIDFRHDLLTVDILVAILILLVFFFPSSVLRIVLGLPFVLFFPGYVLLAALYPRKGSISGIGMTALSFGLSLAVVPLIGLGLNYTPWGITLQSILYSEAGFMLIMSLVAWLRRRRLAESERFGVRFEVDLSAVWGPGAVNKALSIALVVAVLGVLGTLGYVIAKPKTGETFTEFYILGADGKAQDYPRELVVGEQVKVIVGVVNHESKGASYRVEVMVGDAKVNETNVITLANEQKWEGEVAFSAATAGRQKVEFALYRDDGTTPYLEPLRLWVDVAAPTP